MTMENWIKTEGHRNETLKRNGYFLSYNSNDLSDIGISRGYLDSANPETAIVIPNDKKDGRTRFLIYRGDWREALEKIKTLDELKEHWKINGGHFWSDSLED